MFFQLFVCLDQADFVLSTNSVLFHFVADDMLGLSFQLATLEENAAIYLWVMHFLFLLQIFILENGLLSKGLFSIYRLR